MERYVHTYPTVAAGLFVRAFYKAYAEGNIERPSVLALMYVPIYLFLST